MARKHGEDRGIFEYPADSGVWHARWADEFGRDRRRKVGKKKAAKKFYHKMKEEVRQKRLGLVNSDRVEESQRLTVADLLDRYDPEFQRKRSYADDRRYMRYWRAELGTLSIHEVRAGDIEAYRTRRLRDGKSPATVNRTVAFLKRVFNLAIRDDFLERNPVTKVKQFQENNKRVRFLLDAEEGRLDEAMAPEDFEIVEVAFETGLRQAELFNLRKSQLNFESEMITIPRSKSGERREVPMSERACEILKDRCRRALGEWVFPNSTGRRPLDAANWMTRRFRPALEAAGIEDLRFHDLRHTFCSRLVMAGIQLRTVQELAGHQSYETTLRYAHLSPEHVRSAIKALDERRGRKRKGHLEVVK